MKIKPKVPTLGIVTMRGGTNNGMKVQGNCLKPSKGLQGSKQTRPTPRLKAPSLDTKVTLISHEQLTSLKAEDESSATKSNQSYQEVVRGSVWGPPLATPIWNTTSGTVNAVYHPVIKEKPTVQEDMKQLAVGDSVFKTADIKEINKELGTNIKLVSAYCPVNNPKSKCEWSRKLNVEEVLECELKKANYNPIILGLPSIPITDLPGSDVEDLSLKQEASKSSYDMM